MSVIVKDENGKIILMCKGADSVIEERLSPQSKSSEVFEETKKCVDLCAQEGLRTLFLAERVIDPVEFEQWY
jgi:phospholipid-translocating ATPase